MSVKHFCKACTLFLIGGTLYVLLEFVARNRSHWSMGVLGGLCFLLIGEENEKTSWNLGLLWQMLIGGGIVTVLEFFTGLIVNRWLELGVWDYSNMPLNFMGQICLPYSLLWTLAALVAILLDDWLRWKLFDEREPHYRFL